jgi:hypothetical protein
MPFRLRVRRFSACRSLALILVTAIWVMASGPEELQAQQRVADEYEIKAAFIYNFIKFVEWPPEAFSDRDTPIILTIVGPDPFGDALDILKGKTVRGRTFRVRRIKHVEDLQFCHVLYISSSKNAQLPRILADLENSSILTIGETPRFTQLGGVIGFTIEENRIRFTINVEAAGRARLRISSRLLRLARVVGQGPHS